MTRPSKALSPHPAPAPSTARPTDDAPALDAAQRRTLAEALRRADETRDAIEDALVSFGRWMLVHVFDDDAAAALGDRRDNPVWRTLLSRAGGPTLRLSERMLYVALHIAAHDRRITDEAWRSLEPGRKELLLPLGDEALMRKAAQHVTAMKLTQRATRTYVRSLREAQREADGPRLTPARLSARVRSFREAVTDTAYQKKAAEVLRKADDETLAAMRDELLAVQRWSERLLAKIDRRG